MIADIFQPPTWVCVVIVVVTYLCLGTGLVLAWIAFGARRLDRRAAQPPRPEMARARSAAERRRRAA